MIHFAVYFIVGIMTGLILAIPFAFGIKHCMVYNMNPAKREKLRSEAEGKGHVVEAKLDKIHAVNNTGPDNNKNIWIGTYYYSINGKRYKRKFECESPSRMPSKLTLYYKNNPKKAATEWTLGEESVSLLKVYVCTAFAFAAAITIYLEAGGAALLGIKF